MLAAHHDRGDVFLPSFNGVVRRPAQRGQTQRRLAPGIDFGLLTLPQRPEQEPAEVGGGVV